MTKKHLNLISILIRVWLHRTPFLLYFIFKCNVSAPPLSPPPSLPSIYHLSPSSRIHLMISQLASFSGCSIYKLYEWLINEVSQSRNATCATFCHFDICVRVVRVLFTWQVQPPIPPYHRTAILILIY